MTARILVTDDEAVNVQLLVRYLSKNDYQASGATSGEAALAAIQTGIPDLMLLDISMPGMSGLDLCRHLRGNFQTRSIPILLVTARSSLQDRIEGFRSGADDYVLKPFDLEEIKARVEGALVRRRWDLSTNPLTRLPGSPSIEEEVRKRIELQYPFAFAYIDIDQFKAFNDVYGYQAGDQVIRDLAQQIVSLGWMPEPRMSFPGHIGGDDFVLLGDANHLRQVLPRIASAFDQRRDDYYSQADRERGYLISKDRRGAEQQSPLMTLSIAVVTTENRLLPHYGRVVRLASEVKRYLKCQDHGGISLVLWDRRCDLPTSA
jgi:diguanylate cyclase (GGDEF)-like protein